MTDAEHVRGRNPELPISEESRLAVEEDLTTSFPEVRQPWMACADCFSPESCYNGEMDCP